MAVFGVQFYQNMPLEGIAVKDMESSDAVRKNPVTIGPYYMSNIVTGESVEYLPNEYYYGGKPKLDKLVFKSVRFCEHCRSDESETIRYCIINANRYVSNIQRY